MNSPVTMDREQWLAARRELLALEKAHLRSYDELCAARRALPVERVDTAYAFHTERGVESLEALFGGCGQLLMWHFMFAADWEQGCPSCSFWADSVSGIDVHLAARDTTLKAVSNAPLATLLAYRERMGWRFDWVSTCVPSGPASTFSQDFGVTFDEHAGALGYNYAARRGDERGELPGLSVFTRLADGGIAHSYSTYARGLEVFNSAYQLLDLTPKGRDEDDLEFTQAWVRRRDQY